MAQLYVTGPVALFIKHPLDSSPSFLGHGEEAPDVQFNPIWNDERCDLGGTAPFDRVYSGSTARVSVTLIRYNMVVMNSIRTRARTITAAAALPGIDSPGMIGTLGIVEGAAYELWLLWGSRAKPAMNNGSNGILGGGFHFFAAMMDPETVKPGSARALKDSLSFSCYRIFDPADSNAYGFGSMTCWDEDVSAVTGLALD